MNKVKHPVGRLLFRLLLLLILAGIAVLLVRGALVKPEPPEPPEEQRTPVTVKRLAPSTLANTIQLPGRIEADATFRVPAEIPGTVTNVAAEKGDVVTVGQLLLHLDDRTWREHYGQAAIDLREADKELARRKELHLSGATSLAELDSFQTRYDLARTTYRQAAIQLAKTSIRSPADALVNNRFFEQGEYVREGDTVFHLLRLDPVRLHLDIPERHITSVAPGHLLRFQVDALAARSFTGTVSFVAAQASPASHAFPLEALVDNPGLLLRAGMIARVKLDLGELTDVIQIPLAAVVPDKGDHVVYLANGERAERRVVHFDTIRGSRVVIARGLEPGDRLIVEGHRELADGSLIDVHRTIEP